MKVTRTTPVQAPEPVQQARERAPAPRESGKDSVTLSGDVAFVERAREAAAKAPEVRPDVVADVKAQLAAGTFESNVDMDATVQSMLADL